MFSTKFNLHHFCLYTLALIQRGFLLSQTILSWEIKFDVLFFMTLLKRYTLPLMLKFMKAFFQLNC